MSLTCVCTVSGGRALAENNFAGICPQYVPNMYRNMSLTYIPNVAYTLTGGRALAEYKFQTG